MHNHFSLIICIIIFKCLCPECYKMSQELFFGTISSIFSIFRTIILSSFVAKANQVSHSLMRVSRSFVSLQVYDHTLTCIRALFFFLLRKKWHDPFVSKQKSVNVLNYLCYYKKKCFLFLLWVKNVFSSTTRLSISILKLSYHVFTE